MYLAATLRRFRQAKNLSQGDIEKRTGLLRCYISRVENGVTVPSVETLEKFANGLEVALYQLFYAEEEAPPLKPLRVAEGARDWTSGRAGHSYLARITHALANMSEDNRALLLYMAGAMARPSRHNGHKH